MTRPARLAGAARALARLTCALALGAAACTASPSPPDGAPDAGTSPNASIRPAPLPSDTDETTAPDAERGGLAVDPVTGNFVMPDGGVVPEALRPEAPLRPESLPAQQGSGVSLEASFRWLDAAGPPKLAEVSAPGIEAADKLTRFAWTIDLVDTGRMRVSFASRSFALPQRTELRARLDRYGHVLLWPELTEYRLLPAGALRTLLGERRVDVMPLSQGSLKRTGDGQKRLSLPTKKVELTGPLGGVTLEIASVPEAGEGGSLLCRTLVELAGIDPKTPACASQEVVLSARYAWQGGGGLAFEVSALEKRSDLAPAVMVVPPTGAAYNRSGLPGVAGLVFLSRNDVVAFRTGPNRALGPPTDAKAPGEGLVADNRSDQLLYVLLDGVPVVTVPPLTERYVIGTTRAEYHVQFRSFLGDVRGPVELVAMPARVTYPTAVETSDAGAPDAGR